MEDEKIQINFFILFLNDISTQFGYVCYLLDKWFNLFTYKIDMSLRTKRFILILFFVLFLLPAFLHAQTLDSIVVIRQDPEKILKNIDLKSVTQNGFNFWKDDFSGHWAGIDLGFNTSIRTDYSGYETEFMENNLLWSNSLYINVIQQSIGLQHNRNTIGLVTGLGMHFQSYRLDKNTTIERVENDIIQPKTLFFDDNQKSKLAIFSLTMPLLAEFQIPLNNYKNRLYISSGPYISYRLSSHTKIKYRKDQKEKLKVPDAYSMHNFKYGLMVRTGYRWINLFATVELTPMFIKDKGPGLTPFTFGFTLLSF